MEEYRLVNRDGRHVRFTGRLLAQASSQHLEPPLKERWVELFLYRLDDGRYVVHVVGKSTVRNEVDLPALHRVEDALGVMAVLRQRRRGESTTFISEPARDLLDEASNHDEEIRAMLETEDFDPTHTR